MDGFDIDGALLNAVEWARVVGQIHMGGFRKGNLGIDTKSSVYDVVTRVDKESEAYLLKSISATYPDHSILGEETGSHMKESDFCWVVDPLDGTNNYSQGLPVFCVSIGLEYKGEGVLGVVYAPYLNELYTAVKGQGAFYNGEPIHVSGKQDLAHSILASGFPYDKGTHPVNNVANTARILPNLRGFRRMGAAAYDLCGVAAGWLDGYWELCLQPWDACAGSVIVREAGGVVKPFRFDRGISIIAGNEKIVNLISEYVE